MVNHAWEGIYHKDVQDTWEHNALLQMIERDCDRKRRTLLIQPQNIALTMLTKTTLLEGVEQALNSGNRVHLRVDYDNKWYTVEIVANLEEE